VHSPHIIRTKAQKPPQGSINPLARFFSEVEDRRRFQRIQSRKPLRVAPALSQARIQRRPHINSISSLANTKAERIPGYETFKLHEVIRKNEGTRIYKAGEKPDVIQYVEGPAIKPTKDLSSIINERTKGSSIQAEGRRARSASSILAESPPSAPVIVEREPRVIARRDDGVIVKKYV